MSGSDCIFCKIIGGEIPSFKLMENEHAFALMDINPAHEGHALVVSREHAADVYSLSADSVAHVAQAAQRVATAVRDELEPDGLNLIQANGPGAAQSVAHFHIHVLPRVLDDNLSLNWPVNAGDMSAIGALAERIRARLT